MKGEIKMAINLAEKYSKKVDERFYKESLTKVMGGADYDFEGVNTVKVYSIPTSALNNYTRSGSNRYGTPAELEDAVQEMTMTQDKSFTFTIDRGNQKEQMMIKEAGKALARQIREVVVPYKDKYTLSVATAKAIVKGNYVKATLDKTNSYEKFLDCMEKMDNALVPAQGRLAFFEPHALSLISLYSGFTRNVNMEAGKKKVNGQIGEIDNVRVIKAPAPYFTRNVKAICEHPVAMCTPDKLQDYKIHDNPPGINGWLIEGRIIFDAFVLDNKADAICVLVDNVPLLETKSEAGGSGKTKLSYTLPAGLKATDVAKAQYKLASADPTLPDVGSTVSGFTDWVSATTEITASTNTHYTLVLLNTEGKVLYANKGEIVAGT